MTPVSSSSYSSIRRYHWLVIVSTVVIIVVSSIALTVVCNISSFYQPQSSSITKDNTNIIDHHHQRRLASNVHHSKYVRARPSIATLASQPLGVNHNINNQYGSKNRGGSSSNGGFSDGSSSETNSGRPPQVQQHLFLQQLYQEYQRRVSLLRQQQQQQALPSVTEDGQQQIPTITSLTIETFLRELSQSTKPSSPSSSSSSSPLIPPFTVTNDLIEKLEKIDALQRSRQQQHTSSSSSSNSYDPRLFQNNPLRFESNSTQSWINYVNNRKVYYFKNSQQWSSTTTKQDEKGQSSTVSDPMESFLQSLSKRISSLYDSGGGGSAHHRQQASHRNQRLMRRRVSQLSSSHESVSTSNDTNSPSSSLSPPPSSSPLNLVSSELRNCFGKACGNLQFTLQVDSEQLQKLQSFSAATTVPFYPLLKHISQLQSKIASTTYDNDENNGQSLSSSKGSLSQGRLTTTRTTTSSESTSPSSSFPSAVPHQSSKKPLKIVIFTVWVSDEPLSESEINSLNHQQYALFHGYDFVFLWLSTTTYKERYGDLPYGWLSVEFAQELLRNHSTTSSSVDPIDYLVKMDMDCLFSRQDLRLETILHPKEYFSLYLSQIEETSRFTQSHMWIVKNDRFTKRFLSMWLQYRLLGCRDIAQEQGALHFTLGNLLVEYYSPLHSGTNLSSSSAGNNSSSSTSSLTPFTCGSYCHLSHRSAYRHHHCVLDWYEDNGFGMSGFFYHPNIYIYPFFHSNSHATTTASTPSSEHFISPMDGYTLEIDRSKISVSGNTKSGTSSSAISASKRRTSDNSDGGPITGLVSGNEYYQQKTMVSYPPGSGVNHKFKHKAVLAFQPLTIHPCKKNPFLSPVEVMKKINTCF